MRFGLGRFGYFAGLGHLRPLRGALATVLSLGLSLSAVAEACVLPAGGTVVSAKDGSASLSYRVEPTPLMSDTAFAVVFTVCSKARINRAVVDAHMPAHRHGMNYRPSVSATKPNQYRAEGLLFHMAGQWEFVFELQLAPVANEPLRTVRLRHAVEVQ